MIQRWPGKLRALAIQLAEAGQDAIPDNGAVVVYDADYELSKE